MPPGGEAAEAPADQDNTVEEWLLGQELPMPLKPVLGSGAWANFTAALVQMGVIAVLAGLGTFLDQGRPAEYYASTYPELSGIILSLQLDQIYSSPLFLGLLVWLAASIVACTGTTQLPLAKRAQRLTCIPAGALRRRGSFLVRVDCRADGGAEAAADGAAGAAAEAAAATEPVASAAPAQAADPTAGAVSTRLCLLRSTLERRGFAVRTDDDDAPSRLVAQRGLVGKFAPMVVHLALFLTMAGGAAGIVFGASSEVIIGDGGFAEIGQVLDKGRRIKGPLYEFLNPFKSLLDTSQVKVEDFRIKYRDSGEVEQFYSDLVIQDSKTGKKLLSDEIYVNKPLRYGGASIYQADWGIDRLQLYIKDAPVVVPLKKLPDVGEGRQWGAFLPKDLLDAEDASKVRTVRKSDQGVVLVVENMRNVRVFGADRKLAGILRSPTAPAEKKMEGMPIQFGEAITVDGAELRLDKILGSTGLIVKSDPGVPLVYLGFALLMPATLLSVLPFGQVWAAAEEGQLLISGKTNRNQPAFEEEMTAAVVSGMGA